MSALICTVCLGVGACSGSDPPAEPDDSTATSEAVDVVDTPTADTTADADEDDAEVSAADTTQLACLPIAEPGWSRSDQLAGDDSDFVRLAANEQTVVMLGSASDLTTGAATPYHSSDGLRWEAADGFPRMTFGETAVAVAGGPKGFVAATTGDETSPNTPIVAFSSDATTWDRLDPEDLPEAEVAWLSDVVAGSQGFIIVGTRKPPLEEHDPGQLLVWVSSDGRAWTQTDIPGLGTGTADSATLTATDSGWAAVTTDWQGDADSTVGVWTSSDGISWTGIETRGAPPAAAARAYAGTAPLAVIGDRWVLTSVEGTDSPTVWVSTDDGVTWSEHDLGDAPDSTGFVIRDAAATDVGLLLVGARLIASEDSQSFVAHSTDGISWQQCPTTSEFSAVVPFGDGLVLVDAAGSTMVWSEP